MRILRAQRERERERIETEKEGHRDNARSEANDYTLVWTR